MQAVDGHNRTLFHWQCMQLEVQEIARVCKGPVTRGIGTVQF